MNREIQKVAPAYKVEIFICGDRNTINETCQKFCDDVSWCVTVTPTRYVYKGGWEEGWIIGLINYPRIQWSREIIFQKACDLAYKLKEKAGQGSFTVQDDVRSIFVSTRDEDQ